jgi:hypothetical protein
MGESFAFQGFTASNLLTCYIDGDNIVQTDVFGNRKVIGKTAEAYAELDATTTEYYNKLVELGVIVPEKTPEEMMREMQKTMCDMAGVIAALKSEMEGLKHGHERDPANDRKDVSFRESGSGGE